MAKIVGGIGASHSPTIAFAKDTNKQNDPAWAPIFEGFAEGVGACNTVLLKVNQIGTISEAFDTVRVARKHGYGVMPCASRGEGADIADYSVGLGCATIRESASGPTANLLQKIEQELGSRAVFLGKDAFKTGPAEYAVTQATKG